MLVEKSARTSSLLPTATLMRRRGTGCRKSSQCGRDFDGRPNVNDSGERQQQQNQNLCNSTIKNGDHYDGATQRTEGSGTNSATQLTTLATKTTRMVITNDTKNTPIDESMSTIINIMSNIVSDCLQAEMGLLTKTNNDVRDDDDDQNKHNGVINDEGDCILGTIHDFLLNEMLEFGHVDELITEHSWLFGTPRNPQMQSGRQQPALLGYRSSTDELSVAAKTFQSEGMSTLGNTYHDTIIPPSAKSHTAAERNGGFQTLHESHDDDERTNFLAMQMIAQRTMTRVPSNICFKSNDKNKGSRKSSAQADTSSDNNNQAENSLSHQRWMSKLLPLNFRERYLKTTLDRKQQRILNKKGDAQRWTGTRNNINFKNNENKRGDIIVIRNDVSSRNQQQPNHSLRRYRRRDQEQAKHNNDHGYDNDKLMHGPSNGTTGSSDMKMMERHYNDHRHQNLLVYDRYDGLRGKDKYEPIEFHDKYDKYMPYSDGTHDNDLWDKAAHGYDGDGGVVHDHGASARETRINDSRHNEQRWRTKCKRSNKSPLLQFFRRTKTVSF